MSSPSPCVDLFDTALLGRKIPRVTSTWIFASRIISSFIWYTYTQVTRFTVKDNTHTQISVKPIGWMWSLSPSYEKHWKSRNLICMRTPKAGHAARALYLDRCQWVGVCNSHTTPVSRHFYRLINFCCPFSFEKKKKFRSSDSHGILIPGQFDLKINAVTGI